METTYKINGSFYGDDGKKVYSDSFFYLRLHLNSKMKDIFLSGSSLCFQRLMNKLRQITTTENTMHDEENTLEQICDMHR